ncbi:hypothetical protein T3H97_06340 [Paenibacillus sp. LX16]|uniref:hypothetical protein n=1 Tax=Paenibacillus sp. LX16 TaxID=1740264 RepID=UPI002E2A3E5C|nr:hypothetical protein [Paenibacillus sp. LX16]
MSEERVVKGVEPKKEPAYSKTQLLTAKRFERVDKDVLAAILDDEAKYSIAEVEKRIKIFNAKEAK